MTYQSLIICPYPGTWDMYGPLIWVTNTLKLVNITPFPFFTNEAMKKKSGDDVYSSIIVFFFRYWSNWANFSDCIVQDEKKNTHITIHYSNAGNRIINREIKF